MNKLPLVSIIIPVFNREQIIKNTLDSVLKQTYDNWECLVVDDGSEDMTIDILTEYHQLDGRINYYKRHREPKGASTCRNIGLELSKGEYVIFLDSDDYLTPFCLQQREAHFNNFLNYDFLIFPMAIKNGNQIKKKNIAKSKSYLIDFLSFDLAWSIMCPIWKREYLIQINGFTEGYPRLNDPDLMIRALLENDVKFKVLHDVGYDSVYVPSEMEKNIYLEKVYKSLQMFIPDICQTLETKNRNDYKKYLANYLHLWFKSFYVPLNSSKVFKSLTLIKLFYSHKILSLSKSLSLIYRLLGYAVTKDFHQHFKWKLVNKFFYN